MTTQNSAMGDELKDLEQYIKAGYLGALRSDGSSFTDAPATAFADYVMARVSSLLSARDKSRDQQVALAARSKEYQRGRNSVGGESIDEAWERGRRVGMRAFELDSNSEYFKTREGIIEALCMTLWLKSWGEVRGNKRQFERIMGFMRQFDAYVDKRIEESYKPATLKQAQNKEK